MDTAHPPDGPSRAIVVLEQRIARLETQLARWREKHATEQANAAALRERVSRLRLRGAELQAQVQQAKSQHARTHRSVSSATVVRGLLPGRLAMARARALEPQAVARADLFGVTSPAYQAARARSAEAPPPELVRLIIDGAPYWVPALRETDRTPGSRWLDKQRFPYRGILQSREVSVGGIMLDVGANVGHMSVTRAMLGDIVAAYCAEPDPLNYESLVRSVLDNRLEGLVLPDRVAIGATSGTARLRRGRFPGGHHIVDDGDADGLDVEMVTLDAWVRRHAISLSLVSFVKVDVQGFEPFVLDGAGEALAQRHIAWQLEICPAMLARRIGDVGSHIARLAGLFTHFTDLNREASGDHGRPTRELAEALAYVGGADAEQTDILLFNLSG